MLKVFLRKPYSQQIAGNFRKKQNGGLPHHQKTVFLFLLDLIARNIIKSETSDIEKTGKHFLYENHYLYPTVYKGQRKTPYSDNR